MVSYRGCKPVLYNRAFSGVGGLGVEENASEVKLRNLGGHAGECPWVIHTNTLLHIPTCVYPHSQSSLSLFLPLITQMPVHAHCRIHTHY